MIVEGADVAEVVLDFVQSPDAKSSKVAVFAALSAALDRCAECGACAYESRVRSIAMICASTVHISFVVSGPEINMNPILFLVEFGKKRSTDHPAEHFAHHFLLASLQQIFCRAADTAKPSVLDEVSDLFKKMCCEVAGKCVPLASDQVEVIFERVVKKFRNRRAAILFKSFVPHDVRQCPAEVLQLARLFEAWLEPTQDHHDDEKSFAEAVSSIEQLLAKSRMHVMLLLWTAVGIARAKPVHAWDRSPRTVGSLLRRLALFEAAPKMLDYLVMHLLAIHTGKNVVDRTLLFQMLHHELLSLGAAYLTFAESLLADAGKRSQPLPSGAAVILPPVCPSLSEASALLKQVSGDLQQYAQAATSERAVNLSLHSHVAENRVTAAFSTLNHQIPTDGSLVGPRFTTIVFPPVPDSWRLWHEYMEASGGYPAPQRDERYRAAIVFFIRELLTSSFFSAAANVIQSLMDEGINVFLFPSSVPCSSQSLLQKTHSAAQAENVQDSIMSCAEIICSQIQRLITAAEERGEEKMDEVAVTCMSLLARILPVLVAAQTYLAPSHKFPQLMLSTWARVMALFPMPCSSLPPTANTGREEAVSTTRQFISRVFLPMLRVLPPSPFLYTLFNDLLNSLDHATEVDAALFTDSSLVPRFPHDLILFKEHESLLNSSLRRLTTESIGLYAPMLVPVLYANPLFFVEKLLQQSIGFNNEYLPLHTRLLRSAPIAVLRLTLSLGLAAMKRYAAEERDRCEQRVFLIASFLCGVWQNNIPFKEGLGFPCNIFISAIEESLRREARANIIFSTEALKAIFYQLLNDSLEHEEQHSPAQLSALALPYAARWLGRGAAESFYILRWGKGEMTPAMLGQLRLCVRHAFSKRCTIHSGSSETGWDGLIGGKILLHLVRYHSNIYQIHNDLAGTVDQVLLTSAKDFSAFADLMFMVLELLPTGYSTRQQAAFGRVLEATAMPVIQSLIVQRIHSAADAAPKDEKSDPQSLPPLSTSSAENEASGVRSEVALSLADALTTLTLYDICVEDSAYAAALKELARWDQNISNAAAQRATASGSVLPLGPRAGLGQSSGPSFSRSSAAAPHTLNQSEVQSQNWIAAQRESVTADLQAHKKHVAEVLRTVDVNARRWLQELVSLASPSSGVSLGLTDVAHRLLHTRALCRTEDALFIGVFLDLLQRRAATMAERRAVADVILHLVTIVGSMFVAYTDSECKKIGVLLSRLLPLLRAAGKTGQSAKLFTDKGVQELPPVLRRMSPAWVGHQPDVSWLHHLKHLTGDVAPCCLDAEVFLGRVFTTLLGSNNVPGFTYRNVFTALERLKQVFPLTRACARLLTLAAQRHAVSSAKSTFAAATALIKTYAALGGLFLHAEYLVEQELLQDYADAAEVTAVAPTALTGESQLHDDLPDEDPIQPEEVSNEVDEKNSHVEENAEKCEEEEEQQSHQIQDEEQEEHESDSSSRRSGSSSVVSSTSPVGTRSPSQRSSAERPADEVEEEAPSRKRSRSACSAHSSSSQADDN
jgi:hypothetical protein